MAPRRRGKAATARAAAIQAVQQQKQRREGDDDDENNPQQQQEGSGDVEEVVDNFLRSTIAAAATAEFKRQYPTATVPDRAINSIVRGRKRSHDAADNNDCTNHQQQQHQHNHNNHQHKDEDEEEDTDDDCPPPLVGNDEEEEDFAGPRDEEGDEEDEEDDSENFEGDSEDEDYDEDDEEDDNAAVRGDGNSSSNTMSGEGGCLHCHKNAAPSDIQVRCDECQAYICQNCHWCHEFQANHEIRVCDRCDAFYCRTCDEMDQCDDCGEVVCASCSTLLSCKFCGGGLCEECATACGRCGIVLCSRDAKFAVDCDTCRLSYCLVCLASGSKDPCVRCGHRPSKRMEQLVHLRLKSIYKAFKQSSRNSKFAKGRGKDSNSNNNEDNAMDDYDDDMDDDDDDDDDMTDGKSGDPQSLLQAAASAASKHSGGSRGNASSRHSHHHSHHHHSHGHPTTSINSKRSSAASSASRDQQAKAMVDKYMAEKEKADAAAAALLAELEEEEQAEKSKKNKKQRKKERERAKKEGELKQQEPEDDEKEEDSDGDIDLKRVAAPTASNKKGSDDSDKDSKKKKKKKKKGPGSTSNSNNDDEGDGDDDEQQQQDDNAQEEPPTPVNAEEKTKPELDPVEQQLLEFVNDEDMDGIEQILAAIKGVPGRAALRKNAKKALKRLKQQQEEEEAEAAAAAEAQRMAEEEAARKKEAAYSDHHNHHTRSSGAGTPATQSETNSSAAGTGPVRPPPPPLPPNELIRVVTTAAQSKPVSGQYHKAVFHIDPRVVGWIIGKGGQRIRDLMEESGSKVWIDQEHLKEHDPRIIYISGNRKNVESASRLVQELVAKAPITTTGTATASTPAPASAPSPAPVSPPAPLSQTAVAKSSSATATEHGSAANAAAAISEKQRHHQHPVTAAEIVSGNIPSQTPLQEKPATNVNDALQGPTPLGTLLFNKGEDAAGSSPNNITGVPLVGGLPSHPDPAGIENYNEHEMTCEACFVPLLIGRRGWTIKHIQDSSGARVDIDQTVTPRKIRISGRDENVQTAIRMVRDVLSYPHAQLLGAGEPGEERAHRDVQKALGVDLVAATASSLERLQVGESAGATQSNTTTVGASNQILVSGLQPPPIISTQQNERVHTPPPSSTINIGDAKSTISASSSLSSTPEPSMASSSKGHFSAAGLSGSGPLLPPEFGVGGNFSQQHPSMSNSNLFGQQNSMHQMNLGGNVAESHVGNNNGMLPPQHNAPPLFPGGMPGSNLPPVSPRYDMQSGMPRGFSQPQQHVHQQPQHLPQHLQQRPQFGGPSMQHPATLRSVSGPGGMQHQNAHFQPRPEQHVMHHSQSLQYPTAMPGQQNVMQAHHHQSAFHQKQSRHNSAPDLGMSGMGHNPAQGMGNRGMQQGVQGNFAPPGMWNDLGVESPNHGQLQRPSPADSYQLSQLPMRAGNEQSTDLRMNAPLELGGDLIGLQGSALDNGVEAGFRKAGNPLGTPRRDDSRMVDSLFGPSDGGAVEEKNLLPGFQGLSLGEGISTDPWAAKAAPSQKWDAGDEPKSSSALFAAIQPTLDAKDMHHPSRSRFGFNESQQGQSS